MNPLPVIPRPRGQHWQDFRLRAVPPIVVGLAVAATAWLWNRSGGVPLLVGEAETVRADVGALADGTVTELLVHQFQIVAAGDPIAVVAKNDPETLIAGLAAIRADLELTRARMALDEERNVQNNEQLRLDLMTRRIDLATTKINLQQAENELQRVAKLYQEKIAPQGIGVNGQVGYDVALRDRDALRVAVEEKTKLVADLESALQRLQQAFPQPTPGATNDPVGAAITAQERRLRLLESPVTLKAPIAGMVTDILRVQGENVVAGAAVATISAMESDHIVGYVRQPLVIEPKVGMPVRIRTRGFVTRQATEKILQVGAAMKVVTSPLRIRGFNPSLERGLPILIKMPEALKAHVHPGELVDLRILAD
jgi:multidrug resistance efflux pump